VSFIQYPNVFIGTSAYKVSRYPSELIEYMRGNKKHRILFGLTTLPGPEANVSPDLIV
jgi:hypothetical protein